ncbi:MAG: TetR/AcrR family transcriptional regulator [Planctomycetota bacterium]
MNPPPPDTRERILRTAAEAWHAQSYDGVGVAELCRRAQVHKGSFFHFFASKEDLLLAVLDRHAHEIRSWLDAGPFCPDVPPLQRVARFFAGMAEQARQDIAATGAMRGCPIGNVSSELATRIPAVRAATARVFAVMEEVFAQTLREGVAVGELAPDLDPDITARALLAYMQGLAVLGKAFADVNRLDGLQRGIAALLGVPAHALHPPATHAQTKDQRDRPPRATPPRGDD